MDWRRSLSLLVCASAAAGAIWLARYDAGVADAPAHVVPQEFRVAAVETGRLASLSAVPGQRVRAGQLLARLDTSVLEREISVATARLQQFGAETSASVVVLNADGHQNERTFHTDVAEAANLLESARASYAAQRAELNTIDTEIVRQRRLVAQGLARADRADELGVRRQTLLDTSAQWPARIESFEARHREALRRLTQWQTGYKQSTVDTNREARLKPLQDRVAEQVETLKVLRTRLAAASLVAPADADVISVLAQTGDVARAGEPVIVLHAKATRNVVAFVSEQEGSRLAPGAKAILRRRTRQREELPSRITRVTGTVVQLPQRFWIMPAIPQWGREVYLEMPATGLDAGEAIDVKFLAGAAPILTAENQP